MYFLFALACSRSDGPATNADADTDTDTDTDTDADSDADTDTATSGDTGGTTVSTAETGVPPALGACDAFAACGGVPTGRWTLLEVCDATLPSPFPSCPKAVGTRTLAGTGSIELQGSGSYERGQDLTEVTSYAFPASCNPTTCADLQTSLAAAYEDYELTACADDGAGGCTCTNPVHDVESEEQGDYGVDGTVLRFEPGDWFGTPLPDSVDFCAVPGTSLDLLVGEHVYRYVP